MSTLGKVFAALIFLTAIGFFHAAVQTMATLNAWGSKVTAHQKAIEQTQQSLKREVEGDTDAGQSSLVDLEIALHNVQAGRGRAWFGATPTTVAQDAAGLVTATITVLDYDVDPGQPPAPDIEHQLKPPMVVHLFDQRSLVDGGTYLGEFAVTATQESLVTLTSTLPRTPADFQTIDAAKVGAWAVYDVLPGDDRELWASLSDEERKAFRPPAPAQREGETPDDFASRQADYNESVDHFQRDGRPALDTDLDDRIVYVVTFVKQDQAAQQLLTTLGLPVELLQTGAQYEFEKAIGEQLVAAEVATLVEKGVRFRRPLHDYALLFREYARQRPMLTDRAIVAEKMWAAEKTAMEDARDRQVPFAQAEVASLTAEKARLDAEVALAVARRDKLDADLKATLARIDELLTENQRLAADLATLQALAAERAEAALEAAQASAE